MKPRILAISGSSRRDSLNANLLDLAVFGARDFGAEVTVSSLADYELPIYEADWEAEHGLPDAARELRLLVAEHHGLLIASPEHNGGYTVLLKNSIDWISRPDEYEKADRSMLLGKLAAVISATSGAGGGLRSQVALQMVLHRLGVLVLPAPFVLAGVPNAFDSASGLRPGSSEETARHLGATLVQLARLLKDNDSSLVTSSAIG